MFNFKFMPNGCNVCAATVLFSSDIQVSLLAVWKIGLLLTVASLIVVNSIYACQMPEVATTIWKFTSWLLLIVEYHQTLHARSFTLEA